MVLFFNQKEEVISLELTPYGKKKFSDGEFLPKFYSFYDSDILYDGMYGNLYEEQNNIVTRISNGTPRIKTMARFTGSMASVFSYASAAGKDEFIQDSVANSAFFGSLGQSSPYAQNAPAWSIAPISMGDVGFNDGVSYSSAHTIPMMSATLDIRYQPFTMPGGQTSYTLLSNDKIVIDVQELNTIFKGNGNFDIQVMLSGTDGELRSLEFINSDTTEGSNLLDQRDPYTLSRRLNGTEEQISENFPILTDNLVEFFLDIATDTEIENISSVMNSTLYKEQVNRSPAEICDVLDNLGGRD